MKLFKDLVDQRQHSLAILKFLPQVLKLGKEKRTIEVNKMKDYLKDKEQVKMALEGLLQKYGKKDFGIKITLEEFMWRNRGTKTVKLYK